MAWKNVPEKVLAGANTESNLMKSIISTFGFETHIQKESIRSNCTDWEDRRQASKRKMSKTCME